VEYKLRCVDFRRVSDRKRAFQPAFRVTEISDDWYRSTMEVIVTSLGTLQSARENFGSTWEHLGEPATCLGAPATCLGAPATCLGVPATSLGAPTTSLGAPVTTLGAPRIPVEQFGKNILGNAAGGPGNHSYYLSFNDC